MCITKLTASFNFSPYIAIPLGFVVGISAGGLCGFFNGIIITRGNLPPFIVTLGMLEIVRGLALQSTHGMPVSGLPPAIRPIGNAFWVIPVSDAVKLYIPYSLFILIAVGLLFHFVLKYTVFGVRVYAVGSNEQTARLCGVHVERVKVLVYTLGGMTAGLAGFIMTSRLNSGQPSEAVGMELDIIAAVVVGGGSLMGGVGTIFGSVVGAFIIQILRNGCNLVEVSSFVQRIVIGLIIIAAVFADQLRHRSVESKS